MIQNAHDNPGSKSSNRESTPTVAAVVPADTALPGRPQSKPQADGTHIKTFFNLTGGSWLYCLSALSILFGIYQIVRPILSASRLYAERFAAVATLNLYECALLGVMLVIVLWRRVTDDAISLLILIAIFLITNGMVLDQIVLDQISLAGIIGAICFAMALVKLWALRHYILLPLAPALLAGIVLLLAQNFLFSPVAALVKSLGYNDAASLRLYWQVGWLVMLVGAILWYLQNCATATGQNCTAPLDRPFLQTTGMSTIFIAILFVIGGLHQYEQAYIFDISCALGDFIPLIIIGILLSLELLRIYGKRPEASQGGHVVLACVPLALIAIAMHENLLMSDSLWGIGIFWHPNVMLGLTGVAIARLGIKMRYEPMVYLAMVYGLAIVLTAGMVSATPETLNWKAGGGALSALLIVIGIVRRKPNVAIAGVILLAVGCAAIPQIYTLISSHEIFPLTPAMLVFGLGVIGLYLLFPKIKIGIVVIAALLLSIGILCAFLSHFLLLIPVGIMSALLGCLVYRLTRNWWVSLILGVPFAATLVQAIRRIAPENISAWIYVILSFILLGAGLCVSLRKGNRHSP